MNGMRRRLRNLYSRDQVKIINKYRLLWDEHMIWTRAIIISTAANLPDIDAVTCGCFVILTILQKYYLSFMG